MKNRSLNSNKIAAFLLMTVFSLSVFAQGPGQGPKKGEGKNAKGCAYMPDLTAEQEAKIDALRTPHLKFMTEKRADLDVLNAELKALEIVDAPDIAKINDKIEEIGNLKISMAKERAQFKQNVRKLLTEEQKVAFDAHAGKGKPGPKKGGPAKKACANK